MGEMVIISMTIVAIVLIAGISLNGIVDKVMSTKRQRIEARGFSPEPEVRAIADDLTIMRDGAVVWSGPAADKDEHAMAEAMVGRAVEWPVKAAVASTSAPGAVGRT